MRFGVSTRLFQDSALTRDHLVHIAAHDFECIELVTGGPHFDYRAPGAALELAEWLADTRLTLHSVHAPVLDAVRPGATAPRRFSTASSDETQRRAAVEAITTTLALHAQTAFECLVVHLGVPAVGAFPDENHRSAARRSAEQIVDAAARVGVRVAFEVMANPLASADALVHLLEDDLEGLDAGICLDYGHGHLTGDLGDVIEAASGHILTTHLHDNDGRRDAHRLPFAGGIDWAMAMMETQKVGYDGVLMFEVTDPGEPADVLTRLAKVRERLERTLITF